MNSDGLLGNNLINVHSLDRLEALVCVLLSHLADIDQDIARPLRYGLDILGCRDRRNTNSRREQRAFLLNENVVLQRRVRDAVRQLGQFLRR